MSDAFTSLKYLTTRNKPRLAKWLLENYDSFFKKFNSLITSSNAVTRRQSLKLLGEILIENRINFEIMMKYIQTRENLQLMMKCLKNESKAIQFEAFHIFKVFVVNPKKPYSIQLILWNNKKRLISYLESFQLERDEQQFIEDRNLVIKNMEAVERPVDREKNLEVKNSEAIKGPVESVDEKQVVKDTERRVESVDENQLVIEDNGRPVKSV